MPYGVSGTLQHLPCKTVYENEFGHAPRQRPRFPSRTTVRAATACGATHPGQIAAAALDGAQPVRAGLPLASGVRRPPHALRSHPARFTCHDRRGAPQDRLLGHDFHRGLRATVWRLTRPLPGIPHPVRSRCHAIRSFGRFPVRPPRALPSRFDSPEAGARAQEYPPRTVHRNPSGSRGSPIGDWARMKLGGSPGNPRRASKRLRRAGETPSQSSLRGHERPKRPLKHPRPWPKTSLSARITHP